MAKLYVSLYPDWSERIFSLRALVELLGGPVETPTPNPLAEWVGAERVAEFALLIESLRLAQVLRAEDVEFVFASLPPSKKNGERREIFHRYLKSPLVGDFPGRAWAALEKIRESGNAFPTEVHFIRDTFPSFLFEEMAKAFAPFGETNVFESWEYPFTSQNETPGASPIFLGSPTETLDRLAERVARSRDRFPDRLGPFVLFEGDPRDRAYLKLRLASAGFILDDSALESGPSRTSGGHSLLCGLRRDPTRPLKTRLKLAEQLRAWAAGKKPSQTWPDVLKAAVARGDLTPDDGTYLMALAGIPREARPDGETIPAFPAHPLPASVTAFTFLGKRTPNPPTPGGLRDEELFLLRAQGFPVGDRATLTLRRSKLHEVLYRRGSRQLVFREEAPESTTRLRTWRLRRTVLSPDLKCAENLHVSVDKRSVSATQLEAYRRCPSYYFFQNRLRLRKHPPLADESYALLFGQATHRALETYFGLSPETLDPAGLRDHFEAALAELAPQFDRTHPAGRNLREHFRRYAEKIPTLETNLAELRGDARPAILEMPFRLDVEGLEVTGKIDRVDRTSDGRHLILDYKTGNVDFTPHHIQNGDHFQALLYLLAAEARLDPQPQGILFYDLKKGEIRRGILIEGRVPAEARKHVTRGHTLNEEAYAQLRAQGMHALRTIAKSIESGDFTPTPSASACAHCDYGSLCRVRVR